jgi:HD-GYP domain-containing protein (c-di-GMP phosphodiesterase class II)
MPNRHLKLVAELAAEVARIADVDRARIEQLRETALLGDSCEIFAPEAIIQQSGSPSSTKRDNVIKHPTVGSRTLADLLSPAQLDWILQHRECFDATGYPDRLAGSDIVEGAA